MKGGKLGFQHKCKKCMVAYHKQWRETAEGRAKMRAGNIASKRRYPDKQRARHALHNAVLAGRVTPGPCYLEGPECRGVIEGHHHDYAHPLAVIWCCRRHHRALDRTRREHETIARMERQKKSAEFMELLEIAGLLPETTDINPVALLPRRGGLGQ